MFLVHVIFSKKAIKILMVWHLLWPVPNKPVISAARQCFIIMLFGHTFDLIKVIFSWFWRPISCLSRSMPKLTNTRMEWPLTKVRDRNYKYDTVGTLTHWSTSTDNTASNHLQWPCLLRSTCGWLIPLFPCFTSPSHTLPLSLPLAPSLSHTGNYKPCNPINSSVGLILPNSQHQNRV